MEYRILRVMPEFFFDNLFFEYQDSYENTESMEEYIELTRTLDGLPKDAKFIEYRIKPFYHDEIELVFESDEWNEENNFDEIDVEFESIVVEEEKLDKVKELSI